MRKVLHILGYFNEEDTAWIAQVGEKKSISEGSFLIKYKEALANVYFVLDGRFKIQQPNGAEVATIKSGEILGEMSFVEDELPNVNVKAFKDSSVISIRHEFINERFGLEPKFEARFYKAISHFLSSRLRMLASQSQGKKESVIQEDKNIDRSTLERLQIAGERFNRLKNHFD
jgi:CRP-like cAMP-binding protein